MAATKGAMTSPQTRLASEETDNRINFRDSLKFFQEQLVINGTSPSLCKKGKRNGSQDQNTDTFDGDIQSMRNCKISIPTVDSILESVRVLRAIQKSQKELGSNRNSDITSKTDITSEWIEVSAINPDFCIQAELSDTENTESITTESQSNNITLENINENNVTEIIQNSNQDNPDIKNSSDTKDQNSISDSSDLNNFSDTNDQNSTSDNSDLKNSSDTNDQNSISDNSGLKNSSDINDQNLISGNSDLRNSSDTNDQNSISDNSDLNNSSNTIIQNSMQDNFEIKNSKDMKDQNSIPDNFDLNNSSSTTARNFFLDNSGIDISSYANSFWPTSSFLDDDLIKGDVTPDSNFSVELKDDTAEFRVLNSSSKKSTLVGLIPAKCTEKGINKPYQSDICNNCERASEILYDDLNCETNIDDENPLNRPESLSEAFRNILNYFNEKNSCSDEENKTIQDGITKVLKIETYEDMDTQKVSFQINDSAWKDGCLPNSSSSTKLKSNDSDSGIGIQRSASSLSPNVLNELQSDSWSDSSQYVSAECSPYHSLNSVFDTSSRSSSTLDQSAIENENDENATNTLKNKWEDTTEDSSKIIACDKIEHTLKLVMQSQCSKDTESIYDRESANESDTSNVDKRQEEELYTHTQLIIPENGQGVEQDTEDTYCFVTNYTLQHLPFSKTNELIEDTKTFSKISDESKTHSTIENENHTRVDEILEAVSKTQQTNTIQTFCEQQPLEVNEVDEEVERLQKFTATSCNLVSIVEALYSLPEGPAFQVLPGPDETFSETLLVLSEGAFFEYPEDKYLVTIADSTLNILRDSEILLSLNMKYGEVSIGVKNTLKVDNRMGRCVYIKCEFEALINLKTEIELHCLKHWHMDCLELINYPVKCHQNVVIIDLGSCSTRAGILMDQPTLPSIFFPTVCATNKTTGVTIYGMEALQPEVRQDSILSFPVRPSAKITKHTIDIELLEGLFKKVFIDLKLDPTDYTVQVCLPRNLSIAAQNTLVKLLLERLNVKSVSLTNQALLTLYAHDVSTGVVVDIGERTEVLPVVDGFIVDNGVTKLPHGGQRLIHHMKHSLAERHISLSNDIDSFVVQYIIENLCYVASNYEHETQIASCNPDLLQKTLKLQPISSKVSSSKIVILDDARFMICEGLFQPELWGLDSPGIHHLVNKAIQATGVDMRRRIAENIYVSGGVTMLPGFVERLYEEVKKLSNTKIVPKIFASNYRYHCTYIGACKFAKMEVFPQVCICLEEYSRDGISSLKKCALCF